MKIETISTGKATITIPEDELEFLCHAVLETLNAVSEWEFKTRTGERREKAKELMRQFEDILGQIAKQEPRSKF